MKAIHLKIPTTWNELSQKQITNACQILYNAQKALTNVPSQKKEIYAVSFFNLAKELLRENTLKNVKHALKEIQPKAYKPWVSFFYNDIDLQLFTKTITLGDKTLYGPALRLRNLTIKEFSYVDAIYFRFKTSQNPKFLDILCAALYREKAEHPTEVDIRAPFQNILVEKNIPLFQKLPLKHKLPIAFAFEGSRNHLVSQFPRVFPKAKQSPTKKQKLSKPKYIPFGELIAAKIDYDPSRLASVNQTNAYTFFGIYENELKQISKLKRKK